MSLNALRILMGAINSACEGCFYTPSDPEDADTSRSDDATRPSSSQDFDEKKPVKSIQSTQFACKLHLKQREKKADIQEQMVRRTRVTGAACLRARR